MGYTHYTTYSEMSEAEFRAIVADAAELRRVARASHGVKSSVKADFDALTFTLNGVGKDACEPYKFMAGDMFALRPERYSPDWFFCKTMRKPYDMIVGACMISMKYHIGDRVVLSSDGKIEEPDWDRAFRLYHETFPKRPPPPMPFFRTPEESDARYQERYGDGEKGAEAAARQARKAALRSVEAAPRNADPARRSGSRWRFGQAFG